AASHAPDPDVGSYPQDFPLITATGVFLLHRYHLTDEKPGRYRHRICRLSLNILLKYYKLYKLWKGTLHMKLPSWIRKDVLEISLPVMIEQTMVTLMGMINAIMASRIGSEAVSAIGMVDALNMLIISILSAIAIGGTVVVSHYYGREDGSGVRCTIGQSLLGSLLVSFAITLVFTLAGRNILSLLYGAVNSRVMGYMTVYMKIVILGYPFIAVTSMVAGVLRGSGDPKAAMWITLLMNSTNVILTYILIYGFPFGLFHFHGFGFTGAPVGITLARFIGAVYALVLLRRKQGPGGSLLQFEHIRRFKWDVLRSVFRIGVPASLESVIFQVGKLLTQTYIVSMGVAAMAANYIAGSVFNISNIPGLALTTAAITMVGQHMGRGHEKDAKSVLTYTLLAAMALLVVPCTLLLFVGRPLIALYTTDPEVKRLLIPIIQSSVIALPLFWPASFLLPAGLKGAGDTTYTLLTSIIGMWVFRVAGGYILGVSLGLGVFGVWLGMYLDWIVRAGLYYKRLQGDRWTRHQILRDPAGDGIPAVSCETAGDLLQDSNPGWDSKPG
ncbi:MAG TPA: hypothetical protein DD727_09835, partial [Clostridiales bacterium]|nr:hypothetical protein [Clostridiales bacterium]